jgi:hypothetical protein
MRGQELACLLDQSTLVLFSFQVQCLAAPEPARLVLPCRKKRVHARCSMSQHDLFTLVLQTCRPGCGHHQQRNSCQASF